VREFGRIVTAQTMSDRNKWAHRTPIKLKRNPVAGWAVGVAGVVIGSLFAWSGVPGTRDHVIWYWHFSERCGRFVVSPTYRLVGLGGVFLVAGVAVFFARDEPRTEKGPTASCWK
jgi:hypothetical protein